MNPTNDTFPSHICLEIWSWYRGSSDNTTGPPPNAYGSASSVASSSEGGNGSITSIVEGGIGSKASVVRGVYSTISDSGISGA